MDDAEICPYKDAKHCTRPHVHANVRHCRWAARVRHKSQWGGSLVRCWKGKKL